MIFKRREVVQKLTFMEEPVEVAFLKKNAYYKVTFEKMVNFILFLLVSFTYMHI